MSDPIRINGRGISEEAILREMQHHPAPNATEAWQSGAIALAVRELLLQEAERLGIVASAEPDPGGATASGDDERIASLLERELHYPNPSEQECRTWYDNNRQRFVAPSQYRVAHILRPAPPEDAAARRHAHARCVRLLRVLARAPERFADLARQHSRCPSAAQGGSLGLIGPGQTCPELEYALEHLPVGAIATDPIETRYGWHVVLLHERIPGRQLDFDEVRANIAGYLSEAVWRRTVAQYLRILAGRADVQGIDLAAADSPLVQ